MFTTTDSGFQDWVQKIHFENRVDVNLQKPAKNESIKIEIDEVPNLSTSQDNYLQSIVSSKPQTINSTSKVVTCTGVKSSCTCYKCQRQRRRAGHCIDNSNVLSSAANSNSLLKEETRAESLQDPTKSPSRSLPQRSNTIRKTPSLKAYEKHLPRPVYSQQESIYRIETPLRENTEKHKNAVFSSDEADKYEISWKEDETGNDLLSPLVVFQSVFDSTDNDNGLSDLLEQKAKELKSLKCKAEQKRENVIPPRLSECLTISYRQGPQHNPLTLYHTMKMSTGIERSHAYDVAFNHCIQSVSGLSFWIQRNKALAPIKENLPWFQAGHQKTKRSLLSTFKKNSKHHHLSGEEVLYDSTESLGTKLVDTMNAPLHDNVLYSRMLCDGFSTKNKEHNYQEDADPLIKTCDTTELKNAVHIPESNTARLINKSNRLFSSLSRKASIKSFSSDYIIHTRPLEKVKEGLEL
ncbi:hypothetical protein BY458DRAFT_523000 [Sporodiniella umbellata]|nr:hypothetical protein BY458DRAFT_523000 [Sporodiniella umbellata]